ncbi:MAG: hypothetical protein BAJALOKI1v1_110033 [Promethearchaeota archaeon]|nr:MAG: hypothetical protein BAJALOKI1v1_110033 [Candidatus Lokiarchaeota archaeon]
MFLRGHDKCCILQNIKSLSQLITENTFCVLINDTHTHL